ncbi:MAG: hypothetical protein JWR85_4239 [Marmoricola sp.]|nr:hypothetical protein [Marmoricola sp.]
MNFNPVLVKWWLAERVERLQIKVANLMPRWLVYRCAIRLITNGTTGKYAGQCVPELTAADALKRWEK